MDTNHAHLIGEKLLTARKKRKMSLRELASRAEISASMLSQIETGKAYPSVRSIYSIAAALQVPVDYFFPEPAEAIPPAQGTDSNASGEMTASEMREVNISQTTELEKALYPSQVYSKPPVVHASARPTIELKNGVTWARLTALAEAEAEFLEIQYDPGASSGDNLSHHEGREFGLILEGELVVELGFEVFTLRSGDSIIFDSTTPHRLVNKGSQAMRAIWVVLNQG